MPTIYITKYYAEIYLILKRVEGDTSSEDPMMLGYRSRKIKFGVSIQLHVQDVVWDSLQSVSNDFTLRRHVVHLDRN